MYKFIDVNEVSEGLALPSEALKINGEYIENIIDGYRTLTVSGREALSPEITTFETGVRDGSTLQSKRFPARRLLIKYQLVAKSNEEFREAFNKLGSILNVEDAELIFNDEQDKFFIGTPSNISEVEPGSNSVIGEFEITCTDPFKYSVEEYEVEPTLDDGMSFLVDYKGTYKAYPTLEASFYKENETDNATTNTLTGKGDCGFVAFFNENEKIIQLGDPDEEDSENYKKSQTLVNQTFKTSSAWGVAAKTLWTLNTGKTTSSDVVAVGDIGMAVSNPDSASNVAREYYLKASDYSKGDKWHGPSITRKIPADAAGDVGATNFTLTYKHKMSIGNGKNDTKQKGSFQCLIVNGSGASRKIIAGVHVYKNTDGKKAKIKFFVNNKSEKVIDIDLSYHNKYLGNNSTKKKIKTVKTCTITKQGKTITFNIGGIKKTFTSSAIANMLANEVTFTFTKLGTKTPLSYNGIYSAKFVKNNCDTWRDIPNKFSSNDVVVADCKKGEILLNDTVTPEYGALGNDWEGFHLNPGVNQIGVTYSDWVEDAYAPTFKMRYREVFL